MKDTVKASVFNHYTSRMFAKSGTKKRDVVKGESKTSSDHNNKHFLVLVTCDHVATLQYGIFQISWPYG